VLGLIFIWASCEVKFDDSLFTIAARGDSNNNYVSKLSKGDFTFKMKYESDEGYYQENHLDSVRIFVFSMSYQGFDPLEQLAGDPEIFTKALEEHSFNTGLTFGAIGADGDTILPLLTSAPRTYGMSGDFTTLLCFNQENIKKSSPIRIFYQNKFIAKKPLLFTFKN
tara:strand:- start:2415 stop:2915 length:501 start_codon:yes stop_codon:yes gene_type:complete